MGARLSMQGLVNDLRETCGAAPDDEFLGKTYWSDDQLQEILDKHKSRIYGIVLTAQPRYVAGSQVYTEFTFSLPANYWVEAVFVVSDESGVVITSPSYEVSINGKDGFLQFATDYGQGFIHLDLVLYDWHVAAAEVWDKKASQRYDYINVKAGDHKFDAESEYQHCIQQRDYHRSKKIKAFNRSTGGFSGWISRSTLRGARS